MWLKVITFFGLVLEVVSRFAQFINNEGERQAGRLEEQNENFKTIEDKVAEAQTTRSNADGLNDNLLLKPESRPDADGGLPTVQADICKGCTGTEDSAKPINSQPDKSAQLYMGKELSQFEFVIPKRFVNKIFIHCSASDRPEDDNVKTINQWHIARGWQEIGYNYYIDKQGRLWPGRELAKIPAAQHGYNTGSIAICCGGNNYFSVAQMFKLEEVCHAINDTFLKTGKTITFHGHCEVNSHKTCPNFDYKNVLKIDDAGKLAPVIGIN